LGRQSRLPNQRLAGVPLFVVVQGPGACSCPGAYGCALAAAGQRSDGCSGGRTYTYPLRGSHMAAMPNGSRPSLRTLPCSITGIGTGPIGYGHSRDCGFEEKSRGHQERE